MREMTSVLLPNAEMSAEKSTASGIKKSADSESLSSGSQPSEKNDFYAALEQASNQADKPSAKSSQTKETSTEELAEGEREPAKSNDKLEGGEADAADVEHVLAQLTLASELDNTGNLGFSGKLLPLGGDSAAQKVSADSEFAITPNQLLSATVQGDELILDELSQATSAGLTTEAAEQAELLSAEGLDKEMIELLSAKTGLSEKELLALPAEKLTELVALVNSGATNFQQVLAGNATMGTNQAEMNKSADTQGSAIEQGVKAVNTGAAGAAVTGVADAQAHGKGAESVKGETLTATAGKGNEAVDAKLVDAKVGEVKSSDIKYVEPKSGEIKPLEAKPLEAKPVETKPIEVRPLDTKLNNILGEKSIIEVDKNIQVNSKGSVQSTEVTAQQLKGAELSVQLTPVKGGLEFSPAQSDLAADIKTFQTTAQTQSPAVNRTDLPQFQLSLRQGSEQQNMMQDMIQRFSPVMRQQLMTMVSQGVHQAEIRLDPPELGQMMVRVQVQGEQTQVQFQVSQHQTRDLIEQAIPRLKDLLSEQGMQLTDSHVSQDNMGQGERGEDGGSESSGGYGSDMDEITAEDPLLSTNQTTSYSSGIDYYA
ncbi:flagellar hook-length control protein FliK [uncultured Shewanella sp.]|uniref:flagellar hook-length control protein FliK n=1 Tax=uncultured Shewanella sp. TaxID=173975 RepID=UPI00261A6825|nr:flagellar hook-length control protein FliK [uncultured Shewanella sp.]